MKRVKLLANGNAGLDWYGAVGVGLIVFAGAFYVSTLRPAQIELESLREEIRQLERKAKRPDAESAPQTSGDRLAAFYDFFPPPERVPDALGKIFDAAAPQGLTLGLGEYRAVKDNLDRLTRYQLTLPVTGTYPQIRKFVSGALVSVPTAALDGIQFERKKVGEETVEAKIKLIVFVGQPS